METIKPYRNFIVVLLILLIVLSTVCGALISFMSKSAPLLQPTYTAHQLTEQEYKDKLVEWSSQGNHIMDVVIAVLSGQNVPKDTLMQTGQELTLLKADVENTIPPQGYADIHSHYTQSIQDVYDGVVLLAKSNTKAASGKFTNASQQLGMVHELLAKKG